MSSNAALLKGILNNILVVGIGLSLASLGTQLDALLGLPDLRSPLATVVGVLLLIAGFLVRIWATFHFFRRRMIVVSLTPQSTLITTGPYRFSRNPLYLGGNVFVFFGAALLLGSLSALAFTTLHLPLMDLIVRREEAQLQQTFGDEWTHYKNRVRRWI